jgi:TusA-related sulfurtransferase
MLTMLPPGEVLEILTIDPTDLGDIEAWCRGSGMHLLSSHSLHGTYLLRVASDDPQSLAATH